MRAITRIRLTALGGAASFLKGHPDPNPSGNALNGEFDNLVTRATTLAQAHYAHQATAASAAARKVELRDTLRDHMGVLLDIGKAVAKTVPAVTVPHKAVRTRTSDVVFLATARVAVAEAVTYRPAFIKAGMVEDLPEKVSALLDEFDAEMRRRQDAVAAQVGAGAELESVTREAIAMLRHLDSLNRLRFRENADLAAAWKSVRKIPYTTATPEEPAATPGATKSA